MMMEVNRTRHGIGMFKEVLLGWCRGVFENSFGLSREDACVGVNGKEKLREQLT